MSADLSFATQLEYFGTQRALQADDGTSWTYAELARFADSLYLGAGQPKAGTLVALECANRPANIAAYLGALRAACPVLLLDATLDSALKCELYNHYGITWAIGPEGTWHHTGGRGPAAHPSLAVLLSTSGSTGSAKLVKLSLANLQANAQSIALFLGLQSGERPITSLPMHYAYGLSVINSHLLVGATLLLTAEPVTSRPFWDFFRNERASSLAGVPTTFTILRQLRFERMPLPSLMTLTQAGGHLAPEHIEWFAQDARTKGRRFFVMYGQTEAGARIAYVPPDVLTEKCGSIGIAIPGGTLSLVDECGNVIRASNVKGELHYRGPNVMLGYASDAAALVAPDELHGELATGDVGWRDEDGYYFISGRLKRFLKIFGSRIGLDELEAQLQAVGYDVAVTGVDDRLMIAVRGSVQTSPLIDHIAARYQFHRSAIAVQSFSDFPRSAAGKVLYPELQSRFAVTTPAKP